MTNWVYTFGNGRVTSEAADAALLGGKGASLAAMSKLGLPVPPGFTIHTGASRHFLSSGRKLPDGLKDEVAAALEEVATITGRRFGAASKPMFVSVRSGAQASMPGMMDTVLNLGMNSETVEALATETGDARLAYDSY
ncbi:MAG: PEP/pyruvate-binding domain-containing protein, partial [Rhizobiaceae bacterium]